MYTETKAKKRRMPMWIYGIVLAVAAILAVLLILLSHATVQAGYIGVRYRFGEIVETGITPGWRWHIPFAERITQIDTREQVYEVNLTAYTSDTQTVENVDIAVSWAYDTSQLDSIIYNIGLGNVESKLLIPNVNSITKNAIGKYKAEGLIQGRSELQESVETALREVLAPYGINLMAVNVKDIDFEDGFEEAVRLKVEMEQKAQTTQNETVLKQEEATQQVIAAQAEAEAARIKAEAEAYAIQLIQEQLSKSPEYVELQKVEKWNGEFPYIMGNSINPFVTLDGE